MPIANSRPLFLIHQSYQYRKRLPECFDELRRTTTGLDLGVIACLPSMELPRTAAFLDEFADRTDVRLADPELYRHKTFTGTGPNQTQKLYKYLAEPIPQPIDDGWITNVLDYQRAAHATHFLNPSLPLDAGDPRKSLATHMRIVRAALSFSEKPFIASFDVSYHWLTNESLRARLLNEIVDLEHDVLYVRVKWPELRPRHGQINEPCLIRGYRELADVCRTEGKKLILPMTGLSGWLITSFGASGFSMGPTYSQQVHAEQRPFGRQKGRPALPRKERFFSRQLLHVIEKDYHEHLLRYGNGYSRCQCLFCSEMASRGAWSHELAALHYVLTVGQLADEISGLRPTAKSHSLVMDAIAHIKALPMTLKPVRENIPRHLEVWEKELQ